jgi:Cu(I)/Ag(I) efflux system membrane fusion protein
MTKRSALGLSMSIALAAAAFLAGRAVSKGSASAPAAAERKILYWVDPMHPAYRSDAPGTAPDCGMRLEPVYADGPPAPAAGAPPPAGTVSSSPELLQRQGVRVEAVTRGERKQSLRLLGRVVPDERRVYVLNAALEGSIRELADVTTGSFVRKDQRLGAFFSADIRTPLQALLTSLDVIDQDPRARANSGMTPYAGTSASQSAFFSVERLRGQGMSQQQIDEMRKTRKIPLTIDIRSPATGVVLSRNVSVGQKYDKGAEWFRIAALDRVWVLADLAEGDGALARPGAKARVTLPGRPGALAAVVSEVPPSFDAESRTLKLRLELENPGAVLRPDMFVDVDLEIARPEAIVVPAGAVLDSGTRRTVFVEAGEGTYEPRAVETGWRSGGDVEIVGGLSPGERIVVAGTFLVDSESQLRAAAAGFHGAAVRDPVCGMEVDEAKARAAGHALEHGGKPWFFCSDDCKSRFHASPERFAAVAAPAHGQALAAGAGGAP